MIISFDLGDTVPLTFSVVDADGAPTNADTVTLTITLPDDTTTSPTVENPPTTVGLYLCDYEPAQSGRYLVRWTATDPDVAYTDQVDVRSAAPPLIVSLADAKRHIGKDPADTVDDDELREHIEATTGLVEDIRGEAVVRRTVVEDIDVGRPTAAVALATSPVISLTSVASVDGSTTWNVADLHVAGHGIVIAQSGQALFGLVRFTYVAGYTVIPANFVLAAKIIIQHVWETQQRPSLSPRGTFTGPRGTVSIESETMTTIGLGYAVPNRALQLLGGGRRYLVS